MVKALQKGGKPSLPGNNISNNLRGNPHNIGKGTPTKYRPTQGKIK